MPHWACELNMLADAGLNKNSSFFCVYTRYPHQFAAADQAANNIPRSSAPGGENNFMLGWVL
jgi:hypothetical protein